MDRYTKASPFTNGAAFVTGFDLARQSLFKLLREGPPEAWSAAKGNASPRTGTNRELEERSGGNSGA